jgi:hypothetical protein
MKDKTKILELLKLYAYAVPFKVQDFGIVSHPLINSFVQIDKENKMVQITKENYEKHIDELIERMEKYDKIFNILFMVNKPYRLTFLIMIKDYLDEEEYNTVLQDSWTDTEYPHQCKTNDLVALFNRAKPELLMEENELARFKELPDTVVVYRGTQSSKAKIKGLSWSLSREKAEWFSKRFKLNGKVYEATITKERIYAYFGSRGEEEVVLNPRYLKNIKEVEKDDRKICGDKSNEELYRNNESREEQNNDAGDRI